MHFCISLLACIALGHSADSAGLVPPLLCHSRRAKANNGKPAQSRAGKAGQIAYHTKRSCVPSHKNAAKIMAQTPSGMPAAHSALYGQPPWTCHGSLPRCGAAWTAGYFDSGLNAREGLPHRKCCFRCRFILNACPQEALPRPCCCLRRGRHVLSAQRLCADWRADTRCECSSRVGGVLFAMAWLSSFRSLAMLASKVQMTGPGGSAH